MSASSKPIAIPNDLLSLLDEASRLSGLSKQETMRLAMRIGLADWQRSGFSSIADAIVDRSARTIPFPIIGEIAAGVPVDGDQIHGEHWSVPVHIAQSLRQNEQGFVLRVRGDSMINAGINDGDHVLCAVRPPRANDIVVALVDGENTLKRYCFDAGKVTLKAENPR